MTDLLSTAFLMSSHATALPMPDDGNTGIEYTISFGNLLTIGGFIVFVTVYIVNARGAAKILAERLQMVDATLEDFKQEMKKLAEIIVEQTRQDGRVNLIEQRLMQEGRRLDDLGKNLGDFKNLVLREKMTA